MMESIDLATILLSSTVFYPLIPWQFGYIITQVVNYYVVVIIVWAVLSWFGPKGTPYKIYKFLDVVVSPYVDLFRRFMPKSGGIDFSPLIAILVLQFVVRLIVSF